MFRYSELNPRPSLESIKRIDDTRCTTQLP